MRSFLILFFLTVAFNGQVLMAQTRPATKPTAPKTTPNKENQENQSTAVPGKGTDQKSAPAAGNSTAKEPVKLAVPVNVLETFYAKYQKTKEVVWKEVEKEFVVNFKLGEHPLEATFAPDGQWQHTTQNISVNQLPRDIIVRIGKQPALKMKSAKKAESYQRGIVYEVTVLKDGQPVPLVFLPNGRMVSGDGL